MEVSCTAASAKLGWKSESDGAASAERDFVATPVVFVKRESV